MNTAATPPFRRLSDIAVDLERIQAVLGSIRLAPFAASVRENA
jgi:hypothetical protein